MSTQVTIIIALAIYFGVCIGLGLYSNKKSKGLNTRDFLTANGAIPWWVNGICVFAAFNSGGALMGNFGTAYAGGWGFQMTCNTGAAVGMLIASLLVAKPLRNMRVATVPEFLRKRFHCKALNVMIPIILIISITAYSVAQMKVAGMLGEKILNLPYEWGVLIISAVYIFYTALGGMWSITLTDMFQGCVMMFVLLLAGVFCFAEFGGPTEIYSTAVAMRPQWAIHAGNYPWISFFGGFLTWSFVNSCLPHTIMRVFTAKDEKSGRAALSFGSLLIAAFAILALIYITAGAVIVNNGSDLESYDYVFITVIDKVFPKWFQAVVYAGVFAAVMSSVSGMLLSISSAVSFDLIQTLRPQTKEKTVKKITTIGIVVFGIVAAVIALNPPALLTILYASAMGLLASCLAIPTLLGIWWKRMNRWGAVGGVFGGFITFMALYLWADMPSLSQCVIALPVSAILSIVLSLATAPPDDDEIKRVVIGHERQLTDAEL